MDSFTNVIELIPPGSIGSCEIKHDTPTFMDRFLGAKHGMPLTRDKYCRLLVNGRVMMTDAEFERSSNSLVISKCRGNALIAGLGIGLILKPFLHRCDSVTVIEKNADVIELIAPRFPTVKVICEDIFKWTPAKGAKYDTIYFDIWADFCSDDVEAAKGLQRKFKRYLQANGWIGNWAGEAMKTLGLKSNNSRCP